MTSFSTVRSAAWIMPEVITFDAALQKIGSDACSILLGNGFSADYCGQRAVPAMFDALDTPNFMGLATTENQDFVLCQRACTL